MLLQHPFNITISVTTTALHALAGLSPTMLLIILGRHKKNRAVLKNHHVHCPDAKTSEQAIVGAVAAVVAGVVVYVSGSGGSSGMDKNTHISTVPRRPSCNCVEEQQPPQNTRDVFLMSITAIAIPVLALGD